VVINHLSEIPGTGRETAEREVHRHLHRIPVSQRHSTFVILPDTTSTSNGPHGRGKRCSASTTTYLPGFNKTRKRPSLSVVNDVTVPFSFPTVKTAPGSGAALGMSDPALSGPGRVGLTVTTPSIPVTDGDSVCAEQQTEDKTRNARIVRSAELCDSGCARMRKIAHRRFTKSNLKGLLPKCSESFLCRVDPLCHSESGSGRKESLNLRITSSKRCLDAARHDKKSI
jgi:hypothetical protein